MLTAVECTCALPVAFGQASQVSCQLKDSQPTCQLKDCQLSARARSPSPLARRRRYFFFFFVFTLVAGPKRSSSLKLSDTRVYEPQIRVLIVTTTHLQVSCQLEDSQLTRQLENSQLSARAHCRSPSARRRRYHVNLRIVS